MKIFKDGQMSIMGVKQDLFKTDTGCAIIIAKEQGLWHMSISHEERYPNWDEIKQVRYSLLSRTKTFAMLLPPPEEYVNIHNNCFHIHELTEKERRNISQA